MWSYFAFGILTLSPAFLEVEPDQFKPLHDCSQSEIEAQILSRTIQAQALIDEAKALQRYLDAREC